jgi:hypothetical protein
MRGQQNTEFCHCILCGSYIRKILNLLVAYASKLHLIKQDVHPTYSQQLNMISMKQQKFTNYETNCKAKKGQLLKNNGVLGVTTIIQIEQFTL